MRADAETVQTAVPIEDDGPYSGRLSTAAAYVPTGVRQPVGDVGGMARMGAAAVWSAIRHPRGYWHSVFEELSGMVVRCSVPVGLALFGFLLTLCIPSVLFVKVAGVTEYFGPLLLTTSLRSFTPWITALLLAGSVGAALTADLGARKVREEIDAMVVMGIDPIRTLVVPRVVAAAIGTCLMSIPAAMSTVLSIQAAAKFVGGVPLHDFDYFLWSSMSGVELVSMLLNSLLAGLVIGIICCYRGMTAGGGAVGLGKAVNQAVVQAFIALFALQLGYSAIVLSMFPDMGSFR